MKSYCLPKRFALLKSYLLIFIFGSFLIRLLFFIWNFKEIDVSFLTILKTFGIGFFFDIGTASLFAIPYVLYLLIFPKKFNGSLFDRILTISTFSIGLVIFLFSFLAEITFWEEFKRRFNFIAVDYLVYTNEVTKNINESYPIALLVTAILVTVLILVLVTKKRGVFKNTFKNQDDFKVRLTPSFAIVMIALFFGIFITNEQAEQFDNRYNNELAKTGVYSFFAAFRNNELSYTEFYSTIEVDSAFREVKRNLQQGNNQYLKPNDNSIYREIKHSDSLKVAIKPNVIFICIESLNAIYLNHFGSDGTEMTFTPNLDNLADKGILFTNLYATGTRTVRGMEAITLSIPPTPGRSIVKRDDNQGLFTIGEIFKRQGYERNFFYGGDGYFDNMNSYFGGNGFNIVDRGRGYLLDANIKTKRTNLEDHEVTFENAWGVCDEDVYNKVLQQADLSYQSGTPFFNFIMTTSNHRPFTYPDNKIDIESGSGRYGAIKYTDFAIGEFIKSAKSKPWYKNTVFIIMSDHCAYSAGRWALDVQNYHIPGIIFNVPNVVPAKMDKLCSQIDMFPTLFGLLNWDYSSNLFGKDVFQMDKKDERAFIGNYRKLGLLKNNKLLILSEQKQADLYNWKAKDNSLDPAPMDNAFYKETTSFYQVADYLYSNQGLKIKN